MDYLIFIIIAIIFFIVAFKVGVRKKLDLINTIDKEDAEKIIDKNSISKKFGLYYFFLGIVSLLCAYITNMYGSIGLGISISILMILFFISVIMAIRLYWSL
ncbi:MAG: hypothetical protein ACRC6T_09255 [Sarcina sp.]